MVDSPAMKVTAERKKRNRIWGDQVSRLVANFHFSIFNFPPQSQGGRLLRETHRSFGVRVANGHNFVPTKWNEQFKY